MLAGYPPFYTEKNNPIKLYEKILSCDVNYPSFFEAGAKEVNADERGFLRLVANLIGVTDQDSGLARQRVLGTD